LKTLGKHQENMKMHHPSFNKLLPPEKSGVCFFNSNRVWGGGEKWHHDMALKLKKEGYPVSVFTNAGSELHKRLSNTGIPLFSMPLGNTSFLNPIKILRIRRIFRNTRSGTVFLNLSADLKTAGLAAKLAGVPRIIYRRGLANPVKNTALNRFFYGRVITRLIVNSRATRETVLQNNPGLIPEDRVQIVYNGIDLEKFDQLPVREVFCREKDELVIGNSGRLTAQKAQHFLVSLAERMKQEPAPFKVMIAGSGELEGRLKSLAETAGVSDVVRFLGFVDDMKSFMHGIDIFVLTSLWEGFGYVIAEAMACRKPVVAFRISSNPELIEDGKSGFLVKAGDSDALFEKVNLLMHSPALCRKMGENGRAIVEKRFDMPRIFSQLRTIIQP
jgi:glycosyltransferase involved in cell wall biosynthesis